MKDRERGAEKLNIKYYIIVQQERFVCTREQNEIPLLVCKVSSEKIYTNHFKSVYLEIEINAHFTFIVSRFVPSLRKISLKVARHYLLTIRGAPKALSSLRVAKKIPLNPITRLYSDKIHTKLNWLSNSILIDYLHQN